MKKKDQAITLYKKGLKLNDIAKSLNITVGSIKGFVYRHIEANRMPRKSKAMPNISKEREDRIKQLIQFNDGSSSDYTLGEIANEVGLSPEIVKETIRMIEYERRKDEKVKNT